MELSKLQELGFREDDLPRYSDVVPEVVELAARLWRTVGIKPVITSSYRTPQENAQAGGTPGSQHLAGRALDLFFPGIHPGLVVQAAERLKIPGLALQFPSGAIHIDVRPGDHLARWGELVEGSIKTFNHTLDSILQKFGPLVTATGEVVDVAKTVVTSPVGIAVVAAVAVIGLILILRR